MMNIPKPVKYTGIVLGSGAAAFGAYKIFFHHPTAGYVEILPTDDRRVELSKISLQKTWKKIKPLMTQGVPCVDAEATWYEVDGSVNIGKDSPLYNSWRDKTDGDAPLEGLPGKVPIKMVVTEQQFKKYLEGLNWVNSRIRINPSNPPKVLRGEKYADMDKGGDPDDKVLYIMGLVGGPDNLIFGQHLGEPGVSSRLTRELESDFSDAKNEYGCRGIQKETKKWKPTDPKCDQRPLIKSVRRRRN